MARREPEGRLMTWFFCAWHPTRPYKFAEKDDGQPIISHGICPACFAALQQRIRTQETRQDQWARKKQRWLWEQQAGDRGGC